MKIKDGFSLREIAGKKIVVVVGNAVKEFNGVINLNDTGAFLWEQLEKGAEENELVSKMCAEYDVDEVTAKKDIDAFINVLKEKNILK